MYKKYTLNEEFFKEKNANSAYVLGWIISDGCLQIIPKKKYTIRLELKDLNILENINRLLDSNAPIRERKDRGLYTLVINSKKLVRQLLDLGVVPAKTGREVFPDFGEYNRDLIRGIFEGYGSVMVLNKKNNNNQLNSYICSANRKLLEDIGEVIKNEIGATPKIYEETVREKPHYKLRYGAKESAAFYYYMYYENCEHLPRKKEIFEKGISDGSGLGIAECKVCGCRIVRTGSRQIYCKECLVDVIKDRERKRSRQRRAS